MNVKKEDWKTLPFPEKHIQTMLNFKLSAEEFDLVQKGIYPENMDCRWFIYVQDGWLFFHRSWTGHCIYKVKIEQSENSYTLTDLLINKDYSQYKHRDMESEQKLVQYLIENSLLKKMAPFPKLNYEQK